MSDAPESVQPPDEALIAAWRDGDAAAGSALVSRHFMAVYRFFANKLPAEAEDLCQRTFADLQANLARIEDGNSVRAYLMRIARNNLYMKLRQRATHERVFDPAVHSVSALDSGTSPSRALGRRRQTRLLLEGLQRIPLEAQIVLELYYWEELPVKEIADITDVAPGTVMSRLARARSKLEAAMAELSEDEALVRSTFAELGEWAGKLRRELAEDS